MEKGQTHGHTYHEAGIRWASPNNSVCLLGTAEEKGLANLGKWSL